MNLKQKLSLAGKIKFGGKMKNQTILTHRILIGQFGLHVEVMYKG